ncbi:sirohydrochlorin chelatase [Catenuloplanes japonicus]|uniref:sirohydrochlorin chelatase n=1 Tax=Catenuloplanes japonicus TaxID=33876 RepID=UPI000526F230|nr:CbiX/SirB N-terminal domain-containing protein [Catenuloplanes japonicus]
MRAAPLAGTALVLVAHGSRDPRAAHATRALVRAVAAARPGADVRASYLDHAGPRPAEVLHGLETFGCSRAILVPLLLTAAYHGRVDVPDVVRTARADGLRMPVEISDVIGPFDGVVPDLLLAGLLRRLAEVTGARPGTPVRDPGFDAVLLAAAGTNDVVARGTVAQAAVALGDVLGVPSAVAYASASPPTGAEAVTALREAGARRIAIAGYFLAPGLLYDSVVASARSAGGVVAVASPLTDARDIARLVLSRVDAVTFSSEMQAA